MAETYHIMRADNRLFDWSAVEKAQISHYLWEKNGYTPKAWGQVVFVEQVGFLVKMTCEEDSPRSTFVNENDLVCKDSCLEFFANFAPEGKGGYINCEANSYGTLLCGFGPERKGRKMLTELNLPRPEVKPVSAEGVWGYELLIPVSLLARLYGKKEWRSGDVLYGNFYKCGDDTIFPHYGMWNEISWEKPDFHRPEQFGKLILD